MAAAAAVAAAPDAVVVLQEEEEEDDRRASPGVVEYRTGHLQQLRNPLIARSTSRMRSPTWIP